MGASKKDETVGTPVMETKVGIWESIFTASRVENRREGIDSQPDGWECDGWVRRRSQIGVFQLSTWFLKSVCTYMWYLRRCI